MSDLARIPFVLVLCVQMGVLLCHIHQQGISEHPNICGRPEHTHYIISNLQWAAYFFLSERDDDFCTPLVKGEWLHWAQNEQGKFSMGYFFIEFLGWNNTQFLLAESAGIYTSVFKKTSIFLQSWTIRDCSIHPISLPPCSAKIKTTTQTEGKKTKQTSQNTTKPQTN